MKLQAFIEQIDRQSVTVEYIDPFDHGSYRVAINLPDDITEDNFEIFVMQHYPMDYFKRRHHMLTRELPESHNQMVEKYTGKTIEHEVFEAPDQPIVD